MVWQGYRPRVRLVLAGGHASAWFRLWRGPAPGAQRYQAESQQYGNYHEIAALAAIQQPALIVFVGDHRQTLEASPKEGRRQPTGRNCSTDLLDSERSVAQVIIFPLPGLPGLLLYCG